MRILLRHEKVISLFVLSFLLLASLFMASCSDTINEPVQDKNIQGNELSKDNPEVRAAITIQEKHTRNLMQIEDVLGTAVGLNDDGKPCILILTKSDIKTDALAKGLKNPLPDKLDNLLVKVWVTGEIIAFKSTTTSHKAKQTAPIQLGTSGGWRYDLANGYCCGGTLGSLVKIGSTQYVLSNYHVLEADIVSGGNSRTALRGDYVIQPGLIDINCNAANGQNVATLTGIKSLSGSNVDAAIAQVISGMVKTDGSILEVGTISASTVGASINQKVKKSGRTTGLTRSTIAGLNATIRVSYENECAGGSAFTKTFSGQILISNNGSKFLAGGDSGSLMVEDVATNPRAVGLLFAGSTSIAVANPINEVLSFFGASMVGN